MEGSVFVAGGRTTLGDEANPMFLALGVLVADVILSSILPNATPESKFASRNADVFAFS